MTSDLEGTPPPAGETLPTISGWQRVAGALFAPVATFREIARRPDILTPLLVIFLVSAVASAIMAPRVDFETAMREQMEAANRNMSAEDMDRMVRFSASFAKATLYVAPLLNLIFLAVIAGILLLAFRLFGGEGTFKQACSVTLYSWMPLLVLSVAGLAVLLMRGAVSVDDLPTLVLSNLGFLVDMKESPVLFALLTSIDIFTIWTVALFIIGFSFVSGMARSQSTAIVLTLWAVMVAVKLGFTAFGAAQAAGT